MVGSGIYDLGLNISLPEGEIINLSEENFEVQKEGDRKVTFAWEDEEGRFKFSKTLALEIPKKGYYGLLSIKTQNLPLDSSYKLIWSKVNEKG